MDHSGVVGLKEVVFRKTERTRYNIILVFDYFEHDLFGLTARRVRFGLPQAKYIIKEALSGLSALHSQRIMHRDVKSRLSRRQRADRKPR